MLRFGLFLLALTAACQETTTSQTKIVGGVVVDQTSAFQDYVVRVNSCTAVRIRDDLVLTAAHCLQPINRVTDARGGPAYETPFYRVHPGYQAPGSGLHADDIALVYAPNPGGKFLTLASADRSLDPGTTVDLYGFGQSAWDEAGALKPADGLLRQVATRIDHVDTNAHTIYYASDELGSACYGDSGGPMVVGQELIGIAAGHDTQSDVPACTRIGVYADLRQHAAWIEQSAREIQADLNQSCRADAIGSSCKTILGNAKSSQLVGSCQGLQDVFGSLTWDAPLSGCQIRVHGDIIVPADAAAVLKLNLASITEARQILVQSSPNLQDLQICIANTAVDALMIKDNPQLVGLSIRAGALKTLEISRNSQLQGVHVQGLRKVSRLVMQSDSALQTLDFPDLQEAQYLEITDMKTLASLRGLGALARVQNFQIRYTAALKDFTGLEALSQVTGKLLVFRNNALISLTGLEKLEAVENIEFRSNPVFHSTGFVNKNGSTIRDIVKSSFYMEEGQN